MKMEKFLADEEVNLICDRDTVKGAVWAMLETKVKDFLKICDPAEKDEPAKKHIPISVMIAECLDIPGDLDDDFRLLDWATNHTNCSAGAWVNLLPLVNMHRAIVRSPSFDIFSIHRRAEEFDYDYDYVDVNTLDKEERKKHQHAFYESLMAELVILSNPWAVLDSFFNIGIKEYFDYIKSASQSLRYKKSGEEELRKIAADHEKNDQRDLTIGYFFHIVNSVGVPKIRNDPNDIKTIEMIDTIFNELLKRPFEHLARCGKLSEEGRRTI